VPLASYDRSVGASEYQMISSLEIQGYRGFERFELSGLGRVNLLVGTNNSGKTSILESIFLLMSAGDPASLWQVLSRRGERLVTELATSPVTFRIEAEVRHLFSGHEILEGSRFALSATSQTSQRSIAFVVTETSLNPKTFVETADRGGIPLRGLALDVTGHPPAAIPRIPLTHTGGAPRAI